MTEATDERVAVRVVEWTGMERVPRAATEYRIIDGVQAAVLAQYPAFPGACVCVDLNRGGGLHLWECTRGWNMPKKKNHGLWESCLRVVFFTSVRGRWGRCVGWSPDWGG
jgi:hypothetical protein